MDHTDLCSQIRYAERLCERTARLYRHLQAVGTAATVMSGATVLGQLSPMVPEWLSLTGALLFAVFGALMLAVRPADKAAANEADVRRYRELRTRANDLDAATLQRELFRAQQSDAPEVELLRRPAWNDVAQELGAGDEALYPLSPRERLVSLMA